MADSTGGGAKKAPSKKNAKKAPAKKATASKKAARKLKKIVDAIRDTVKGPDTDSGGPRRH